MAIVTNSWNNLLSRLKKLQKSEKFVTLFHNCSFTNPTIESRSVELHLDHHRHCDCRCLSLHRWPWLHCRSRLPECFTMFYASWNTDVLMHFQWGMTVYEMIGRRLIIDIQCAWQSPITLFFWQLQKHCNSDLVLNSILTGVSINSVPRSKMQTGLLLLWVTWLPELFVPESRRVWQRLARSFANLNNLDNSVKVSFKNCYQSFKNWYFLQTCDCLV